MANDDWVAAPPDDGGHQGVFTVPSDEQQCPDAGEARHPPSDQDPSRPGGEGAAGSMIGWAVAFIFITLFFIGAYGFAC